jgi:hypothetical protein
MSTTKHGKTKIPKKIVVFCRSLYFHLPSRNSHFTALADAEVPLGCLLVSLAAAQITVPSLEELRARWPQAAPIPEATDATLETLLALGTPLVLKGEFKDHAALSVPICHYAERYHHT